MKRIFCLVVCMCLMWAMLSGCAPQPDRPPGLPAPQADEAIPFGVDKSINMNTIDGYLGRDDVCYRDVRMLFDPADYEAIGGEATLTRTIYGFKVTPYPYIATLSELPVSKGYSGPCLYTLRWNEDGKIATAEPNYLESAMILDELFPKDKAIFLMCGGGGYSGMMKSLLIYLGWDESLLYNIGGNWTYTGENVQELVVYPEEADGDLFYATWRADYAYIEFDRLNPVS